jgi:hypothetical protein
MAKNGKTGWVRYSMPPTPPFCYKVKSPFLDQHIQKVMRRLNLSLPGILKRENADHATLDVYQSGGGSDQSVWCKEFKVDLARGISAFMPTKMDGFPCVYLKD